MAKKDSFVYKIVNHDYLLYVISFFLVALVFGFGISYAYYNSTEPVSIFANTIGDFDSGDADVTIMIYKENDNGTYVRTYSVPSMGYSFDSSLTSCLHGHNRVTCVNNDPTANCNYSYNIANRTFSLTSNAPVTCKFYFSKSSGSDINLRILIEDENGTITKTGSNILYSLVNNIPAYGYSYSSYSCDEEGTTISYNSELRKFSVTTTVKNDCYAYFNKSGSSDASVSVRVQSESGSNIYNQVDFIPVNKVYILSSNMTSECRKTDNTVDNNAVISYSNGEITITSNNKVNCVVYLDLDE